MKLLTKLKPHWPLLLATIILISLLWRNPFSTRTLIPNFEPFPDSFHYLTPAKCLVKGEGFYMCLPGQIGHPQSVPPAYSLLLVPFYFIYQDPRVFYFLNVALSLTSLRLLYLISQKITKNKFVTGLGLLVYVTTYFTYWFPSLVMAENLLITTFLAGIYLLTLPPSRVRAVLAGGVIALTYGAKYAALGSMVGLGLLYLIHLIKNSKAKERLVLVGLFTSTLGSLYLLFGGLGTVQTVIAFFKPFFAQTPATSSGEVVSQHSWYASPANIWDNLVFYTAFFTGKQLRILWDVRSLLAPVVSLTASLGLVISLFFKKSRYLAGSLIFLVISQLIPILPFYVGDGRYGMTIFPVLILGLILALNLLEKLPIKKIFINLGLIILTIFYLLSKATPLRLQLALNLKYAETPWWYLATLEMNQYFTSQDFETKPYLITLISPYYLDFFSNDTYQSLPLSVYQDFKSSSENVWGFSSEAQLIDIYRQKLENNQLVFITNYGISATQGFADEFNLIINTFEGELIQEGCHQQCNLYRLQL